MNSKYYQISELDSSNICLRYSRGCWGHTIYLSIIQMAGLDNLMKNCKIIFHQNNNHSSPSTKAKGKISAVAIHHHRFSTFSNLCIVVTCTAVLIIPRVIILTRPGPPPADGALDNFSYDNYKELPSQRCSARSQQD